MKIYENISLKNKTTMKIGGTVRFYVEIESIDEIDPLNEFLNQANLPIFVLGGGSNIIIDDKPLDTICLHLVNKGINIKNKDNQFTTLEIQSGENWDDVVSWCVDKNLAGLESLSLIPGSFGGAIVQNIGAYGSEIKDYVNTVTIYSLKHNKIYELKKADCDFSYRHSRFKNQKTINEIVLSATLKLTTNNKPPIPAYKGVGERLSNNYTLKDIRNTIIQIRQEKLPDPNITPNTGSFFTNPVINQDHYQKLKEKFPQIPGYTVDDMIKVPAGWLIENAGLKGKTLNNFTISQKHALVITNPKEIGTYNQLQETISQIKKSIRDRFNIELIEEPVFIKK